MPAYADAECVGDLYNSHGYGRDLQLVARLRPAHRAAELLEPARKCPPPQRSVSRNASQRDAAAMFRCFGRRLEQVPAVAPAELLFFFNMAPNAVAPSSPMLL